MNRRSLLKRAGATVIGALAAMMGIRPKNAEGCSCCDSSAPESFELYYYPFGESAPWKIVAAHRGDEPLQLWFNCRFYVDLPEERYTDTVEVAWVIAKEWEDRYEAECRVRPGVGEPWETLPMRRAGVPREEA